MIKSYTKEELINLTAWHTNEGNAASERMNHSEAQFHYEQARRFEKMLKNIQEEK